MEFWVYGCIIRMFIDDNRKMLLTTKSFTFDTNYLTIVLLLFILSSFPYLHLNSNTCLYMCVELAKRSKNYVFTGYKIEPKAINDTKETDGYMRLKEKMIM